MLRPFCRAKIHRARVTAARLEYEGSVSVDAALLEAAGILPYEMVQITNLENGVRWHTYAVPAGAGTGVVCLNGPPARWFQPGDRVILLAQALLDEAEVHGHRARVVFVDEANRLQRVETHAVREGQAWEVKAAE